MRAVLAAETAAVRADPTRQANSTAEARCESMLVPWRDATRAEPDLAQRNAQHESNAGPPFADVS